MFAVDTNLFVYAHFEKYPQHKKAKMFCENLLSGEEAWFIGWQICYEYIRVTTHPRIHEKPLTLAEAINDLVPYLESENCQILTETPQHLQIVRLIAERLPSAKGNLIHDFHYAALLREHGIKSIYTADSDFRKFDFLEVRDPTQ